LEIIKVLAGLPIWVILFPLRFLIAFLNLASFKKPKVCETSTFLKPSPYRNGSVAIQYEVFSSEKLHLGHLIICYIRGKIQNKKIFEVDNIYDEDGFRKDHKVNEESYARVVTIKDLNQIKKDCQLLS